MRFRPAIRSFIFSTLLLLLCATGTGLSAQSPADSSATQSIQRDGRQSAPVRGTVVWMRQEGWSDISPEGHKSGIIFELLDKLSEDGNLKFDYVEASGKKELKNLLLSGKADLFVEDGGTSTFDGITVIPDSIGPAGMLLLCSRPGDERFSADNFVALDGKTLALKDKVAVIRNTETFEHSKGFSTKKRYYDSVAEIRQALISGGTDLAILSNYDDSSGLIIQAKFGLTERHFAVRDSRSDLKEALSSEMEKIQLKDPLYLHKLSIRFSDSQKSGIMAFSRKEQDFIRNAPPVDLYIRNDLPMYSWETNGRYTGFFHIMLEQISRDTGLQFNIKGYTDTAVLAEDFNKRTDPYALCVLPSSDDSIRDGILRSTGTATSFNLLLMARKDDRKDIKTVSYNKDAHLRVLVAEHNFTGREYGDGTESFAAVLNGEVDAVLVENYMAQLLMNRREFRNTFTVRFDTVITNDLVFAAKAGNDGNLISIMNKAMQNLDEDDLWSYTRASSPIDYWGTSITDLLLDNWYVLLLIALVFIAGILVIVIQHRFTKRLELSNKNKDVFLADMSHDFRTPLTAISGFAYLGKSESDPRYYAEIITSAAYMQELVNDILNIRQYSEGKAIELQPEPVIADTLYDSILSVMHGRAAAKNIQIHFDSKISYPYISVDPMRVRQVFVNIIGNAVKYSPAGSSIEVTVEDYMKAHTARVKAVIADHGEGMSKDFIKQRIFRPFEREKNAFSAKEGGSGLGLAITKIIMDRMGGTIAVESELGEGSTFTLDFPELTITKEEYDQTHKADSLPKNKEFDFSGTRVLLCEDNEVNTFIVSNILQKRGCVVDCAADGKSGLEKFEQSPPRYYSAILMDIRMPVMDGIEAAKAIRALNRADAQQVPIVALSANAFEEDKMTSAKAGMNAHLSKPVNVDSLFKTLGQLLHTF